MIRRRSPTFADGESDVVFARMMEEPARAVAAE